MEEEEEEGWMRTWDIHIWRIDIVPGGEEVCLHAPICTCSLATRAGPGLVAPGKEDEAEFCEDVAV